MQAARAAGFRAQVGQIVRQGRLVAMLLQRLDDLERQDGQLAVDLVLHEDIGADRFSRRFAGTLQGRFGIAHAEHQDAFAIGQIVCGSIEA